VFTPFASVRGDAAALTVSNEPGVSNFINSGESTVTRGMPTVGLEYRYPFIGVQGWGTQTLEPIGQLIVRPNEPMVGKLPNEDAQSLVFDDTNLFKVDKFSGWDRIEGGGRANAGLQYIAQFNRGGNLTCCSASPTSYSASTRSRPATSPTPASAAVWTRANRTTSRASRSSRTRSTPSRRGSASTRAISRCNAWRSRRGPRSTAGTPPSSTASTQRSRSSGSWRGATAILTSGAYKVSENWVVNGGVRYDIQAGKLSQTRLGIGYIDDCFIMSFQVLHGLHLQRQCVVEPDLHAAGKLAHDRRNRIPVSRQRHIGEEKTA